MSRIIDLSHRIEDHMPVYPGHSEARLYQVRKIDVDRYNDHRLEISMHVGTHIDGPMHLTHSKTYLYEFPIDTFVGNGCLLDVRGEQHISYKKEYEDKVKDNDIVLLYTGFDKKYGTDEYFRNYPVADMELAEFFIRKHIKILAMDIPAPDKDHLFHQALFSNKILVAENLTNLEKLLDAEKFEITALPLNIKADSSIARIIARVY